MALGSDLSTFSRPAAKAGRSTPAPRRTWAIASGAVLLAAVLLLAWWVRR